MVTRRGRSDAGLTLVELMVTIIVASLVATSTFMFFSGQQRIYETQTKMLSTQQSVWAAMETVTRYARAAGSGLLGCVRPDSDGPGSVVDFGDPPPVPGPPNAIGDTALDKGPATGLRAYHQPMDKMIRIAPFWISDGGANNSDTLTVAYGEGTFGNWSDADLGAAMADNAAVLTVAAGGASIFKIDDFVLVFDRAASPAQANWDRGCTLFWMSANGDTATNQLFKGVTVPYNRWNKATAVANLVPFPYAPATTGVRHLGSFRWIRFRIDNTTNVPRLMMQRLDDGSADQILAEGLEDLQVSYACDNNNNGRLDDNPPSTSDEFNLNFPGDDPFSTVVAAGATLPPRACNRPEAIRITLVSRSTSADAASPLLARPTVENHDWGGSPPTDRFRRRVFTSTVFPRN